MLQGHGLCYNGDFSASGEESLNPALLLNLQGGGDVSSYEQTSPLGLTLRRTPSFLNLVEKMRLDQERNNNSSTEAYHPSVHDLSRAKMDEAEKKKASNFPALVLKIGSWERISRNEGDLTAKCYFAKKKIVWEILEGALKSKIEIQWCDIEAIRAIIHDNEPGILEIELNQPPQFYREINPQPRKHTLWQPASDFTGGQAPICRRHCIKFSPGTLNKHYDKIMQCDSRLFELSQRPFPKMEYPYFYSHYYGVTNLSYEFGSCQPGVQPVIQYPFAAVPRTSSLVSPHPIPIQSFKPTNGQPMGIAESNSPMSVIDFSPRVECVNSYAFDNQRAANWSVEGIRSAEDTYAREDTVQANAEFSCQGYQEVPAYGREAGRAHDQSNGFLGDIEYHFLGDSQVVCSNDGTVLARVRSVYSLPLEEANHENNIDAEQRFDYKQERFSESNSMMGTAGEYFEGEHGTIFYPLPLHCLPPQVSHENSMIQLPRENYQYVYQESAVDGYVV